MTGAVLVAFGIALCLLALLVFGLLRSHATILKRLHDLDGGEGLPTRADPGPAPIRTDAGSAPAASVVGVSLTGEHLSIATSGVSHDTLLVFLSSGCLTCQDFWSAFVAPGGVSIPAGTRLVLVTKDLSEESPSVLGELAPPGVELVTSSQAWVDYKVPGSPYVIAVHGPDGHIQGEGTGMSWEQVAGLLAQATGDRSYVVPGDQVSVGKPLSDVDREARVDRELLQAGVLPGDASLYPGDSEKGPAT